MLNSSRNVFVIILKLNFKFNLELVLIKKTISNSRVSFYLKSGIFHEPGSPKDTQRDTLLAIYDPVYDTH